MIDIIEILVSINGAKATMLEEIYSNNANQYRALIKFEDDSWNNYDKMIVFDRVKNYDTPIGIMVEEDNKELIEIIDQQSFYCVIPWEILTQPGYFTISIHGALDNSQKSLTIKNKFTIYDGGNATIYPRVPTPNMYEQLLGKVKELSNKIDINTKSDAGRTTPEGGEIFNDYETNQALGLWSHVEGGRCDDPNDIEQHNIARGVRAHIEGSGNTVTEGTYDAHVEGSLNTGAHNQVHVEGYKNIASEHQAHAEGHSNIASGVQSHVEGWDNEASGMQSHAEGTHTTASGDQSHTEGNGNTASGARSHAEGNNTKATGINSHTEGQETIADGFDSHAEGLYSHASGQNSHAEGQSTLASGTNSHAEGVSTEATFPQAHAEGQRTKALNSAAHAEGYITEASGQASHTEGRNTKAKSYGTHAGGMYVEVEGEAGFAHGLHLISKKRAQFVVGEANDDTTIDNALFVVGNGVGDLWSNKVTKRSNAFVVNKDGSATIQTSGTNDLNVVNYKQLKDYVNDNGKSPWDSQSEMLFKTGRIRVVNDVGDQDFGISIYDSNFVHSMCQLYNANLMLEDYGLQASVNLSPKELYFSMNSEAQPNNGKGGTLYIRPYEVQYDTIIKSWEDILNGSPWDNQNEMLFSTGALKIVNHTPTSEGENDIDYGIYLDNNYSENAEFTSQRLLLDSRGHGSSASLTNNGLAIISKNSVPYISLKRVDDTGKPVISLEINNDSVIYNSKSITWDRLFAAIEKIENVVDVSVEGQ